MTWFDKSQYHMVDKIGEYPVPTFDNTQHQEMTRLSVENENLKLDIVHLTSRIDDLESENFLLNKKYLWAMRQIKQARELLEEELEPDGPEHLAYIGDVDELEREMEREFHTFPSPTLVHPGETLEIVGVPGAVLEVLIDCRTEDPSGPTT